jgi:hypothetical protein
MKNVLLIFDTLLMILIILFPYQFDGFRSVKSTDFENYLLLSFLFIIIKSIFGIIIFLNKIKNEIKIPFPIKCLIVSFPLVILTTLHLLAYIFKIKYNFPFIRSYYDFILVIIFLSIIIFIIFLVIFVFLILKNKNNKIICLFKKFKYKLKLSFKKSYLLFIIPMIFLIIFYLYLYILRGIFSPLFIKFDFIFILILNFYGFVIFIGFLMWILNWTFFETNIKKLYLILYKILTYLCIIKLIFELYISFLQ